jgi:hypothetical protein
MFKSRLLGKLESEQFVTWIPRLPRNAVMEFVSIADIAWCVRDQFFESQTRELSTKVLECLLVRTPPIVVKSKIHLDLFGEDWPFFVESPTDMSWKENVRSKLIDAHEKVSRLQPKLENHKIEHISKQFSKLLG